MNPSAPARSGRGRRGITLTVLAGFLAPAAVLSAAAPVVAAPDNGGSASGAPATAASIRAVARAAATDGPDAAGYLFGYSSACNPVLEVTTADEQVAIPATDTGWYDVTGSHNAFNTNYIVGTDVSSYRNFLVFDPSSLSGEVLSARLDLVQGGGCSSGGGALSSYSLNDVTTPVADLVAGGAAGEAGQAVYRDLREGQLFGRTTVSDVNQDVSVALTRAGLRSLASADGLFAVGGAYYDGLPLASTTLTADPVAAEGEIGGDVTLTATVADEQQRGVPSGTVDFTQDGSAIVDCTDVALVAGATETDGATATCVVPGVARGRYVFAATYSGDEGYEAGDADDLVYDTRATPEVSVALTDETQGLYRTEVVTLTTEVTGVEGESAPSGVVGFDVDGEPVDGCQDVALSELVGTVSARATCETSFEETGEHAVTTRYDGDGTYRAGVDGPLAVDVLSDAPTISAAVTSSDEPSATGWFQAPATVTFTCESFHGLDSSGCPEPVTVGSNGRAELERTITDGEGQQASTSVVVKVDKRAPRVVVRHVRDGATYDRMRQARCTAFDRHSRVAGDCETETQVVRQFRDGRREVAFTATAMDRSDNVKQKSGTFFVR